MKIGILLPLSNTYPGIALDYMDGFNSLLVQKQASNDITIIKENVGFGGAEKEVYAKAEKLLISEDVDVLVAYIDEKVTGMLYSLVQSTGKLVLVVNPGANHPLNWIAQPTVIHLTLQHAFLCNLTGKLAASKDAAYASSFYDCGYLHSADMVKSFMANGGNILHNYINNQPYDDNFDINQLTDFLSFNAACENILCVYDQLPATLFYDRLKNHKSDRPLQLFVSPMMLTAETLSTRSREFSFSVQGYIPWRADKDSEHNHLFLKSCRRHASIFSLLGWETGLIIAEIKQHLTGCFQEGEKMVAHLVASPLSGPRGEMNLDPDTLYYTAPVGMLTLHTCSVEPAIKWVPNPENEWMAFTAMETEGAVAGWTNTYLCY